MEFVLTCNSPIQTGNIPGLAAGVPHNQILLYRFLLPDEKQILNSGIFHAGFFALKRSSETLKFLDWWQKRTAEKGYIQLCKGMNGDQLWLEHVPIFFEKVLVEKHEGLNVGAWNLAERKLRT